MFNYDGEPMVRIHLYSSGESGTNSLIGSTQGPVTSSNPIWQRAADWSAKAQSLVRVMKIRLLVFLQHERHETIDISPVVSPRIATASLTSQVP